MPKDLSRLPAQDDRGRFNAVIEVPKGSEVKLTYDPEMGAFRFSRALVLGLSYPFDWGFIPSTRAPDGDPLDVMVLLEARTFPGVVIPCRPVGVVELEQDAKNGKGRQRNDRVIAAPAGSGRSQEIQHVRELDRRLREELEQFFVSATFFEGKNPKILGWKGPKTAHQLIAQARKQFRD
jgi:inorganic pyrophosphatase